MTFELGDKERSICGTCMEEEEKKKEENDTYFIILGVPERLEGFTMESWNLF